VKRLTRERQRHAQNLQGLAPSARARRSSWAQIFSRSRLPVKAVHGGQVISPEGFRSVEARSHDALERAGPKVAFLAKPVATSARLCRYGNTGRVENCSYWGVG
jgi:hypothetical protein